MAEGQPGHTADDPFTVAGSESFSHLLDEALGRSGDLIREADALAASISSAPPQALYAAATEFENAVQEARPVLDRLVEVLRNARHHTLESAWLALAGQPDRQEDARKLREIITEYHRVRAVLAMSGRQIEDTMRGLQRTEWATTRTETVSTSTISLKA